MRVGNVTGLLDLAAARLFGIFRVGGYEVFHRSTVQKAQERAFAEWLSGAHATSVPDHAPR